MPELTIGSLINDLYVAIRNEVIGEPTSDARRLHVSDQQSPTWMDRARCMMRTQEVVDALTTLVRDDEIVVRLRSAITHHERLLRHVPDPLRPNPVLVAAAQACLDAEKTLTYVDSYLQRFVS